MIMLSAVLRAGTFEGTARIRDTVDRAGGLILDARELGGHSIALTLEIPAVRVKDLRAGLRALPAVLLEDGEARLDRATRWSAPRSTRRRLCSCTWPS